MDSSPLITVIVPVYNAEKYLAKCIDSILSQELGQGDSIEIILINDGSTDNSREICDFYADTYSNIRIVHKKNERVSSARNTGIRMANGRYISFIDSDDWVEHKMYLCMSKKLKKYDLDFVMCDFIRKGSIEEPVTQNIESGFYNKEKIESEIFNKLIMYDDINLPANVSNCTCIFNKKFLLENDIFYDEDIHYCEDLLFGTKTMYYAKKIYYLKGYYFYNYFENSNSTTRSYNYNKWVNYLKINTRLNENFSNSNYDFSNQIKINMIYFTLNMLGEINKSNDKFQLKRQRCKEIINNHRVRQAFKDVRLSNNLNIKLKLILYIIKLRFSYIYSILFYRRKIL